MSTADSWTIVNERHDPQALGQHNSVFTISNGYLGLKGNLAEDRDGYCPVTIINGVYDELDMFSTIRASNEDRRYLDPRYFDSAGKSPAVANLPNPLFTRVFVHGREVSFSRGRIGAFRQSLEMRSGLYRYEYEFTDVAGRTLRIKMERFASLNLARRVYLRYVVTPINFDGSVRVQMGIDGDVHSNITRERQFRVIGAHAGRHTAHGTSTSEFSLHANTPARGHDVRMLGIVRSTTEQFNRIESFVEHDRAYVEYEWTAAPNATVGFDRFLALASSEDVRHGVNVPIEREAEAAASEGFDAALVTQRAAWEKLWQRADVVIEGDDAAQRALRFSLFHLIAAAPRHSDRLSVPVKLLSGDYYQGNTFYDTDTYIVPFYTFVLPEYARTCLNWRWEGLKPGREIARQLGLEGAKFAWQAGPLGEECLGRWWRFTHTNIHINADVAYAVMQYRWATGDERFFTERGVELLVETARFYRSRAERDESTGEYHLRNVAGPDEGHCESTDNFYTNYMAQRNLEWAIAAVTPQSPGGPPAETSAWREVASGLSLRFDPATKVYEQCVGFYQLKDIPSDLLTERKVWFVTVAPYKALNQPDVIMAMVLFRDDFPADVQRANWDYYKTKSMNFSSMSFALNSIMAAEMGEPQDAYRDFIISAANDLDEELTGRRDTYAGLHGTGMGGAWMAAVFGFGGVSLSSRGLRIRPKLPEKWSRLTIPLMYQGERLNIDITQTEVRISAGRERAVALEMEVCGRAVRIRSGEVVTIAVSPQVS